MSVAEERPFVASEPHECKQRAEDPGRHDDSRLIWAVLAVAAELRELRRLLAKRR